MPAPSATSAGALFVRSYERGERVYLAMASRGYVGTMPVRSAPATRASVGACACCGRCGGHGRRRGWRG